jgi:predicted flap endonuclease-1-like 5' DNA nuclease
MFFLNILNNETFLLIAEVLFIVIGSMLLGILLASLNGGGLRKKIADLTLALEEEKKQSAELREQVSELSLFRSELTSGAEELKTKLAEQSKTIYDQQLYILNSESAYKNQKAAIDDLNATIDSYQHRINVIQEELLKAKATDSRLRKVSAVPQVRANYEHVSKLLGRQVTENDLTLIAGIGPKTADLLQSHGIDTWDDLARTPIDQLQEMLNKAGGIYKSLDPTHWAKQAVMASQGEWRKLRVYQEALRKSE